MRSVYDVVVQKPFTLDTLAQTELEFDRFYSYMKPEQRDFYLRSALEIGEREATRYAGQDVNALTRQLGVDVYDPARELPERDKGRSGPYAEYDAETRRITVHERGMRSVAVLIYPLVRKDPEYSWPTPAAKDAMLHAARELLIAHELFHHLEATSLGPVHRTLPPVSVPLLGGFWKARRYVLRTREIAAHSFAFTLLGMNERFPRTLPKRTL